MDYNTWIETYKPLPWNWRPGMRLVEDNGGSMKIDNYHEPEVWAYLQEMAKQNRVWTECLNDGWHISSGLHWVNRNAYIVTAVPYTEDVFIDMEFEGVEEYIEVTLKLRIPATDQIVEELNYPATGTELEKQKWALQLVDSFYEPLAEATEHCENIHMKTTAIELKKFDRAEFDLFPGIEI